MAPITILNLTDSHLTGTVKYLENYLLTERLENLIQLSKAPMVMTEMFTVITVIILDNMSFMN